MTGPSSENPSHANLYQHAVRTLSAQNAETISACPVCGGESARPHFEIEGIASHVWVCEGCGLARLHPMLDESELAGLYPDEYYGEPGTKFQPLIERMVRAVGERHIAFLSRGLRPGARILDVGCGRGVTLGALADRGFEIHGQEISAEAARGADARAKICIAQNLVEANYDAVSFDEIIIWHVLEHLPDPRATLEEAHRILKPGGRLIVAVPNFSSLQARWSGDAWFHLDLPRHLYQFPLHALQEILVDTGFRVGPAYHFSLRQNPFGWIQSALNRIPGVPRNGLYVLLHRRGSDSEPPFGAGMRAILWLLLGVTLLPALAATVIATLARSGGSVHVVAER
jgi:SAM-dependent methyltransferase